MADLEQPGCFGFVVCYEPESEFCSGCPYQAQCSQVVLARRKALESLLAGRVAGAPRGTLKSPLSAIETAVRIEPKVTETPKKETVVEEKTETKRGSLPKRYAPGEMSKKAKALDESLKRLGVDAPALLKAGKNPLAGVERLTFFRMACEQLLTDKALDRNKLRDAYMEKLGWDVKTANSHLSIVGSYLSAHEIVAIDGKTYVRVAL